MSIAYEYSGLILPFHQTLAIIQNGSFLAQMNKCIDSRINPWNSKLGNHDKSAEKGEFVNGTWLHNMVLDCIMNKYSIAIVC